MEDGMKVSIITVCLNSAKTIEQTIQSVINQTYQNIEYIMVDGQSVDGTVEIIKKYAKHIALFISEPDAGIYDAMNKGISMATGDIIGIINSDDWYDFHTVEKVIEIFLQDKVDLVYGDEMRIYENGLMKRCTTGSIELLSCRMNMSHPTVFVKKEIYEKYGKFDLQYKSAADYDFLLRMYHLGIKMKECPEILAYYRTGGFSETDGILSVNETRDIALKHLSKEEMPQYLSVIEKEYKLKMQWLQGKEDIKTLFRNCEKQAIKNALEVIFAGKRIYIFGAGTIGRETDIFLSMLEIEAEGFVDNKKSENEYNGKHLCRLADINGKNAFIIIAVLLYQEEIKNQLIKEEYVEKKDFCIFADLTEKLKGDLLG